MGDRLLHTLAEQMRAWAKELSSGRKSAPLAVCAGLIDVANDVERSQAYSREATLDEDDHDGLVQRAREEYADGSDDNIEIDDDAFLSNGEDGCWVSAWVWLRFDEEDDV